MLTIGDYIAPATRAGITSAFRSFQTKGNYLYAMVAARYLGVRTSDKTWIGSSSNSDVFSVHAIEFYILPGCSITFYSTEIKTCSHNWVVDSVLAPTCVQDDCTTLHCTLCDATQTAYVTAATGYDYRTTTVTLTAAKQGYG